MPSLLFMNTLIIYGVTSSGQLINAQAPVVARDCAQWPLDGVDNIEKMRRPAETTIDYFCNNTSDTTILLPDNCTDLHVEFYSCTGSRPIPGGLFRYWSRSWNIKKLILSATESNNIDTSYNITRLIRQIPENFLDGLNNVCEIELRGFENLDKAQHYLQSTLLRPVTNFLPRPPAPR